MLEGKALLEAIECSNTLEGELEELEHGHNLPTPEGSINILSGLYSSYTCFNALAKSPTSEQHMQPEFNSRKQGYKTV